MRSTLLLQYALFLILFSILTSLHAHQTLTPLKLQLQWKHQFQFAGYYMAKEKGFYNDVDIEVDIVEYNNKINIHNDINSGRTEFAIGHSSLISKQENNIILLAAIFQSAPYILHAKKREDIKTLKDIKNKRVMLSDNSCDMASINAMLKTEGIPEDSFTPIPTTFDPNSLITGETDFMSSYISNEPYILKQKGVESTIFDPKDYGFDFYSDILFTSTKFADKHPKLVDNFYHASLKGWEYAFAHIEETIEIIQTDYNTQKKSHDALLYEAEVLKKLAYIKGVKLGTIDPLRLREISNIYRLLGVESNVTKDFSKIIFKPLDKSSGKLNYTQQKYLQHRAPIKMCVDPNWMPYEKLENGKYTGMSSDYIQHISAFIQHPIEVVETKTWQESLALGRQRECDIFSLVVETAERKSFLNFTKPYFSFPLVLATTMDKIYTSNLESIVDKKIAMVKGYAYNEILKKRYPQLTLIEVTNIEKGLELLNKNKIYGFIDTLPTLNYQIQKNYLNSLKINGQFDEHWELGIGIRNDDPILFSIFEKAVKEIDAKVTQQIMNEWLHIRFENGFDYKQLFKWLPFILAIILLVLYKYSLSIRHNKELKSSIKSFELLMESTLEGIMIFDKNAICLQVNEKMASIYGYTQEEFIGKHAMHLVAPISREIIKRNMQNRDQNAYEATLLKKDGTQFFGLVRGKDIVWNGQEVRVSSVIDISTIKQLQHELEALNKTLEEKVTKQVEDIRQKDQMLLQQSKLAAMGEMIGAIAHQWRQPLNALNINIQNLDDDFAEGLINKKFIDLFINENRQTIEFMSKTIDDFRNFYRIDKVKEKFSTLKSIEDTTLIQSAQLKNYKIDLEITGDDFIITGYKSEFQQVILNLVNNAKDAIDEQKIKHGKINILLKDREIIICDNAGGIDKDSVDRIFEPYYTTKEQGKGTGIGLYMSKRIIEDNMEGKLNVCNSDKGAQFTISF
ncbi:MAG: ABC transporter substrate-binding protein [Epsilonproteobacteria bacterium]|nr:ABC transporter substrate-binding protein [Campylobacterota bacterium]